MDQEVVFRFIERIKEVGRDFIDFILILSIGFLIEFPDEKFSSILILELDLDLDLILRGEV